VSTKSSFLLRYSELRIRKNLRFMDNWSVGTKVKTLNTIWWERNKPGPWHVGEIIYFLLHYSTQNFEGGETIM
jgi:hypothetical protein